MSIEELKRMPVEEIVELLKNYRSSSSISTINLGDKIRTVVEDNPERFASKARLFQGLDLDNSVYPVLKGFFNAVRNGKSFDFKPVMDLCKWVLSQPQRHLNPDPHHLLFNSPFGLSIWMVIQHLLKLKERGDELSFDLQQSGASAEVSELKKTLESILDPSREDARVIWALFGYQLDELLRIDRDWVKDHIAKIFPKEQENAHLFEAAWNGYRSKRMYMSQGMRMYMSQGMVMDEVLFEHVPIEDLGEHLMDAYALGILQLDDPKLVAFYDRAPDDLRARTVRFMITFLGNAREEQLERLKRLCEWRLDAARNAQTGFEKEVLAFFWWLESERFDLEWSLDKISSAVQLYSELPTEEIFVLLGYLEKAAALQPARSLACLKLIVKRVPQGSIRCEFSCLISKILKNLSRSPETRQEATDFMNILASGGFLKLEELLENED